MSDVLEFLRLNSESEFPNRKLGDLNRKTLRETSEIERSLIVIHGIANRELKIGNRIANTPRQIRWWPSSSRSEFF